MNAVGMRVEFVKQKWPDLLKAGARSGSCRCGTLGNISTTTDGYGFLGLLYGGSAGLSNLARFKLPEFDRLYEQALPLPDGPERTKLMQRDVGARHGVRAVEARRRTATRTSSSIRGSSGYKHNAFNPHPLAVLRHRPRAARRGEVSGRIAA